ncbi:hypothetical protein FRC08_013111 [Ceratobasidium sp. 394]|nr:hypothetical protein FRC08_013111 [Ceratobasidium sp. 394]
MAENSVANAGSPTETGNSLLKRLARRGAYSISLAIICSHLIGTAFSDGFGVVFKNARTSTYLEALRTTMILLVMVSGALGTRMGKSWGFGPGALIFCVGLALLKGQINGTLRGFIIGLALSAFGCGRMVASIL